MDDQKRRDYASKASNPFFGAPPVPPDWLDIDDPDLLEDLEPPRLAYHYTTPAGFVGIVEAKDGLRATLHHCLNDAKEVAYGYGIVRSVIEELRADFGATAYDLLIKKLDALSKEDSFLASLSEAPDVLSQWRAYANDGAGYCLGFRVAPFQTTGYHAINAFRYLIKCRYGEVAVADACRNRLRRKITRMQDILAKDSRWASERDRFLALECAMVAWRHAHLAKHEHFAEEREWRVVMGGQLIREGFALRVGPRGLVPYVMTGQLPIEEVWIGPGIGPSEAVAERATLHLLRHHGLEAKVRYWASSYVGR